MGPSRRFKFLQGYQNSGKARRAVGTAVGTRRHLKKGVEFLLQSQSRGQGDELTRELRALSIWAGGAENAPSAFLCQFDEGAGQGRPHPLGWEIGSSVSLSPAASASAEREQRGTHRALKAPQKKNNPAPDAEPSRSCTGSKEEEIGGEGILLALHHRSPTTSIFAVRMASGTRHCYSYSIQRIGTSA